MVQGTLVRYRVLKLIDISLMRVGESLLSSIVSCWDLDYEAFVVQGHRITLAIK